LLFSNGSTSEGAPQSPPARFYLRTEKEPISETVFPFSLFGKQDDRQKSGNPKGEEISGSTKSRERLHQLK
jgi:hypothetical protein